MNKETILTVGTITAAPGCKAQGYHNVPGTPVNMPVTLINGAQEGKIVLITGGTHGGEYPGIEATIRLAQETDPAQISGGLIIVHPVNVPAFEAKLQYLGPYDGLNLNRVYPGKALGTVTERIANTIVTDMMRQSDFCMDLHGGDIHEELVPFVAYSNCGTQAQMDFSLAASRATGIKYLSPDVDYSTGTVYGYAASIGIPGFLAEIGDLGLWNEENVAEYMESVRNVLRFLQVLPGEALDYPDSVILPDVAGVSAQVTGCWYPSIGMDATIQKGDKVGEVRDFFGNVLQECFAPVDGFPLYIVRSLAVSVGNPLLCIGILP